MSGRPDYASLLAQPARAGVYHLPQNGEAAVAAVARNLGYPWLTVDLAPVRDKATLLAALARTLAFPAWFGHNWDALADCLGDMSWRPAAGYVLVLAHADALRAAAEGDFLLLLEILAETSQRWREEGVPFWTFVDLAADGIALLPSLG